MGFVQGTAGLCLSALVLIGLPWASARAATLENQQWRVELDPATLAISVTPAQGARVQASSGSAQARAVSALQQRNQQLRWQWDEGAWQLSASLEQGELQLSIQARQPGELNFIRQPAQAMGKGLIWPLAEGHYVPAGDRLWQQFLLAEGAFNTTQDLSLPLWGVDHGSFTLHWLLTNPYNNQLTLSAGQGGLAIEARHEFTSLQPDAALTFSLYLGDADVLAGAKRYKRWLIDNGRYETLSNKLLKTPQAAKLFGAPHAYLWGTGLLGRGDIQSWPALLQVLRERDGLGQQLYRYLDEEARGIVDNERKSLYRYQQNVLLRGLNAALNSKARERWQSTPESDMQQLAGSYGELREQVAQAFGQALRPRPETWGDGLSLRTIEQLQVAGLSRLWLGLGDAWEGGLWHPEAVRAGVAAGYLMAPYDSYETVLAPSDNPDWTTAHLGATAYQECAIVLRDGTLKSGFQNTGYYTDPACVRPLLEARIKAVQAQAGFNSWFLDVYATGMLFDSYRPGATMSQAQNAERFIQASRWVGETRGLVIGSEDGNAVTAQGVLFAHGMQTPVIGWGDTDLAKNKNSPWYLGNWYPPEQPAVFFKPVPLKEPYRSIHFAPQTRLPLYQAVFHGSVITSHHWLFDSLKLSNVRQENELTQLLYNVPPLYHLSSDSLKQRLAQIQRQDAFFRPLHERLVTQALSDFRWLSEDRQVQQVAFADGTRLVANFSQDARTIDGRTYPASSVVAVPVTGEQTEYRVGG